MIVWFKEDLGGIIHFWYSKIYLRYRGWPPIFNMLRNNNTPAHNGPLPSSHTFIFHRIKNRMFRCLIIVFYAPGRIWQIPSNSESPQKCSCGSSFNVYVCFTARLYQTVQFEITFNWHIRLGHTSGTTMNEMGKCIHDSAIELYNQKSAIKLLCDIFARKKKFAFGLKKKHCVFNNVNWSKTINHQRQRNIFWIHMSNFVFSDVPAE